MYFRDLNRQYKALKKDIDANIIEVIEEGKFILGEKVSELEKQLAEYVGVKHCITCANGTDALMLVLMAWGVSKGDAVFTSDFTFFASAEAAAFLGATPILVDINLDTYNICPNALENAIKNVLEEGKLTPKAIIPVDLFGLPADYESIELIAKKYNLQILEDGAQSFGGSINDKKACSFGDAAITSFFPSKPLGCYGDGGAIFTNESETDKILRSLRAHGSMPGNKYDNKLIGVNSRLDAIQAAILLPKLKAYIEYELNDINNIALQYTERLSSIIKTPYIPRGYTSAWAQYTILLRSKEERDELKSHLDKNSIPSIIYYPKGLHQQTALNYQTISDNEFPSTIEASNRVLSLPIHPYVYKVEIEQLCEIISKKIMGN